MTTFVESDWPTEENDSLLSSVITAAELHHVTFEPLAEFVPGLVVEGFGIVAGPPKLGKSWWTLNLALAVASGGYAFGKISVPERDVLLLALEDSHRRVQSRIRDVWGDGIPPHRLHILTDVGPGVLIATMTAWLQHHQSGLVILDTLGRARPQRRRGDDPYIADYQAGVALKNVVDAFPGSALLGVHHTRKASSDDFVDDLSGTLGLAGSADYVLVLRRQRNSNDANLQVTGRDAPEGEYAFSVEGGAWKLSGDGLAAAATEAQNRRETKNLGDRALEALAFVNAHPGGVSPEDVARHLNITANDAGTYLRRLHGKGCINKPARGIYTPVLVSEVSEVSFTQVDVPTESDTINVAVSEVSETELPLNFRKYESDTRHDQTDTDQSEVSEAENVIYLHKDDESDTKDTSDTNTHQAVSENSGRRIDWPSREDWEADERRTAEYLIETGLWRGGEGDNPTFTDEEREEAETLAPLAVKQIRKACGEVERTLRAAQPTAAAAADPNRWDYRTEEGIDQWSAAVDALQGEDRAAYDDLIRMREIRERIKGMTRSYLNPERITTHFVSWPASFDHPESAEISRLAELRNQAVERHREANRERGRRMLAALESPGAWDEELARRARLDDYFRNGPIVRRHHTDGTVTDGRLGDE